MKPQSMILETSLDGQSPMSRGKVRDIYDLGALLLIVATDRISAFDYVLPNGIPSKGKVLTQMSAFWFAHTERLVQNHVIAAEPGTFPAHLRDFAEQMGGRAMLVRKAQRIDAECVVRGYLAGSAWAEYSERGTVCGQRLPAGLIESERLAQPIFTPSTKADAGHDENISVDQLAAMIGEPLARQLEQKTLEIYQYAEGVARKRGIIIADTKMEFGLLDGELILIDELLTPDSSRFWPADGYQPGRSQPSFDKQFVRDWLSASGWNKQPPPPVLPDDIVQKTAEKYLEAYERLTGQKL